jgi:hypothetical protein
MIGRLHTPASHHALHPVSRVACPGTATAREDAAVGFLDRLVGLFLGSAERYYERGVHHLEAGRLGLALAGMLYRAAHYIYDNGDIVRDGETIQGIGPDARWKCRHEVSLVEPVRPVLDVMPDAPHAAGPRR